MQKEGTHWCPMPPRSCQRGRSRCLPWLAPLLTWLPGRRRATLSGSHSFLLCFCLRDIHPGLSAALEAHHPLAAPYPALSLRGARWASPRQPGQILSPALSLPGPLGSQEEGLAGQQMAGWEEGLPGRRTTVRTDGRLGRGPELAHLLLPLQGLFSAPPAELGWAHLSPSGCSVPGSGLVSLPCDPLGSHNPS